MDFEMVFELIEAIGVSCPEVAEKLLSVANKAVGVSCSANASEKDTLFDDIESVLIEAEKQCPEMAEQIKELRSIYEDNKNVRCGGG